MNPNEIHEEPRYAPDLDDHVIFDMRRFHAADPETGGPLNWLLVVHDGALQAVEVEYDRLRERYDAAAPPSKWIRDSNVVRAWCRLWPHGAVTTSESERLEAEQRIQAGIQRFIELNTHNLRIPCFVTREEVVTSVERPSLTLREFYCEAQGPRRDGWEESKGERCRLMTEDHVRWPLLYEVPAPSGLSARTPAPELVPVGTRSADAGEPDCYGGYRQVLVATGDPKFDPGRALGGRRVLCGRCSAPIRVREVK